MAKQGQNHTILGANDNVIVWIAENFYPAFINTIQKGVLVGLVTIEENARKNNFIGGRMSIMWNELQDKVQFKNSKMIG